MADRGEFMNAQNASEAQVRAVEALEKNPPNLALAVANLCDAVRMLAEENRLIKAILRGGPL